MERNDFSLKLDKNSHKKHLNDANLKKQSLLSNSEHQFAEDSSIVS